MKNIIRMICLLLVLASVSCACAPASTPETTTGTTGTTSTTAPTQPSVKPTEPPAPTVPQLADINRPLPVLAEKKVTGTPAAGDLVLAEEGVAKAVIVYPQGNKDASAAAMDLANYLQKITGAAFPTVHDGNQIPENNLILVGPTKQTADLGVEVTENYPKSEEYIIRRIGNALILLGNDYGPYKCTQFAVNRFLEEAGCGWYSTEELWQVVPDCPTLAVKDWDQTFKPYFTSRTMGHIPGSLGNRWNLGGDSHQIGHGLQWLVGKNHVSAHPEWYPEIGGVRPVTAGWYQFCYTNEGLADYVAGRVISIFNGNPNQCNYTIAANDGWDEGWCECENCTAVGNETDQLLVFANRVAEKVAAVHPDRTVSILAYHSTFLPPLNTKAHPNVEVMFCVETNPFTDPTLDWVVHEGFNGMTRVEYSQSWQDSCYQYINEAEVTTTAIWAWFCITADESSWYGAPWVQGNTVTRTFQLYREMGISRVFADCGGEMTRLRWPLFYVYARSMWDDAVDGETILYDACQKLYGPVADEMFLFYRLLADCAAINIHDGGLTWVPPPMFSVYGDYIMEIRETVAAARAKLDLLNPEQLERVMFQLSTWDYVEVVI